MLHKIFSLIFLGFLGLTTNALASQFILDEDALNLQFESSIDCTSHFYSGQDLVGTGRIASSVFDDETPSYQTAAIMAFAETVVPYAIYAGWVFFTGITGGLGILLLPGAFLLSSFVSSPYHRYYLGTSDRRIEIGALYCLTGNGLGILTLVDGVMLLMADEGHTNYIDNDRFIMWLHE